MNRKYELLRDAIKSFNISFTVTFADKSGIPSEHTLAQVVELLVLSLGEGKPIAEPRPLMAGGEIQCFQIPICEPMAQGGQPKPIVLIQLHADPIDRASPIIGSDQRAIAAGLIAIAVGRFFEEAQAGRAGARPQGAAQPPAEVVDFKAT